jgi:hypothetical protein
MRAFGSRLLTILSAAAVFVFAPGVLAKTPIAVIDLNAAAGVAETDAATISESLRGELIHLGRFDVVERAQVDKILEEQGLTMTGCTDAGCGVMVGKLAGARAIVMGDVFGLAGGYKLLVRLVDVELGTVEGQYEGEALSTLSLLDLTADAARAVGAMYRVTGKIIQKTPSGYYADVGLAAGVNEGATLSVERILNKYTNAAGEVVFVKKKALGEAMAKHVTDELCRVVPKKGAADFELGDVVSLAE